MKAIVLAIAIVAMPAVALAQAALAPQWDAEPSSPHEITVAKCFQNEPWQDRDNSSLNRCLANAKLMRKLPKRQ